MKLELLRIDEYDKVKDIYLSQCGQEPANNTITIAVLIEGEKVVGCCAIEVIPIISKLWIDPQYRGNGLGKKLFEKLEKFLIPTTNGYYAFPSNRYSEKIVQEVGMVHTGWPLYMKEF